MEKGIGALHFYDQYVSFNALCAFQLSPIRKSHHYIFRAPEDSPREGNPIRCVQYLYTFNVISTQSGVSEL